MAERLEVQRAVAASAGEIFAVLTDPRGHVAIDSSGMLMAASGDIVAKAGDTFVVHMDREALNDYPLGLYDVTVEIVTFEPDREIAWTVHGQLDLGHMYGYRLEPIEEGTLVTSYYDWSAAEQDWKDAAIFPVIPESALRATLGILARTVAPGKPRPAHSTRKTADEAQAAGELDLNAPAFWMTSSSSVPLQPRGQAGGGPIRAWRISVTRPSATR